MSVVKRVVVIVVAALSALPLAEHPAFAQANCDPTTDSCCDAYGNPTGTLAHLCCDRGLLPDGTCTWQATACPASTNLAVDLSTCQQPPPDAGATLSFNALTPRQGVCIVAPGANLTIPNEPLGCLTVVPHSDSLDYDPWGVTAFQERVQIPVDPRWNAWEICYGAPPCSDSRLVRTPVSGSCCTLATAFQPIEQTGTEWVETLSAVPDVPHDMAPDAPYCKVDRNAACNARSALRKDLCELIDDGCDAGGTAWCDPCAAQGLICANVGVNPGFLDGGVQADGAAAAAIPSGCVPCSVDAGCGACTTVTSCAARGTACGTISDGCGHALYCGDCDGGVCTAGQCVYATPDDATTTATTPSIPTPHTTCSASPGPARGSAIALGFASVLMGLAASRRRRGARGL